MIRIFIVLLTFLSASQGLALTADIFLPPELTGQKYGETPGMLQFRGNPTHTYYGSGVMPDNPGIVWSYPDRAMDTTDHKGKVT